MGEPGRERGAEGDVSPVAVADDDGAASTDHRQEVVDMAVQRGVEREHLARTLVAAPVVDDGVEVTEPPLDPGETGAPIQRSVDQHHHRGVGLGVIRYRVR